MKFEAGQRPEPAEAAGAVLPPASVVVAGTFAAVLLAGLPPRTEEDCPPRGAARVLEAAEPGVEQ